MNLTLVGFHEVKASLTIRHPGWLVAGICALNTRFRLQANQNDENKLNFQSPELGLKKSILPEMRMKMVLYAEIIFEKDNGI